MAGDAEMRRSKLKVGVLILIALSAVGGVFFLISGKTGGFLLGKVRVRAYFKNATGLKVGAPVNLNGVTIGNVRSIRIVAHPEQTPVEVVMAVGDKYRGDLLTDSQANLSTVGVLGSTEVDIDNRHAHGSPIAKDGVLLTGGAPNLEAALSSFQSTTQKFDSTLNQVNVLMGTLSNNKGSIGKLINDPTLRTHAAKAMNELSSIPAQASQGKGTIGKLMTDRSLAGRLTDMGAKLSKISTAINNGQGTAGKFMKDPSLSRNLKETSSQLHEASTEVASGNGAMGMMLHNGEFKKKLQDTGQQANLLAAQMNAGKGTLGQMEKNGSLARSLKELTGNSRVLVTGLRKHPMKYVSLHLRIF